MIGPWSIGARSIGAWSIVGPVGPWLISSRSLVVGRRLASLWRLAARGLPCLRSNRCWRRSWLRSRFCFLNCSRGSRCCSARPPVACAWIQRVFERRFPPPRETPTAFRAGTISSPRPDAALASDAMSAEDPRVQQREMTSVVLRRGSSSTKSVAALGYCCPNLLSFSTSVVRLM